MLLAQEMRKIALQTNKEKDEEVDTDFLLNVEMLIKTKASQGEFGIGIAVRKLNGVTMYQLRHKLDQEGFTYRLDPKDILHISW